MTKIKLRHVLIAAGAMWLFLKVAPLVRQPERIAAASEKAVGSAITPFILTAFRAAESIHANLLGLLIAVTLIGSFIIGTWTFYRSIG